VRIGERIFSWANWRIAQSGVLGDDWGMCSSWVFLICCCCLPFFVFFHFFHIWGFPPLQPLQYLDMVSLNRWVFLYFTSIHEVFFWMKGYKLATPVILQSEQFLDCCVWLLDQIFSGFTAKDVQWYRPNSAEWESCCNTMRFTSTIWPIVCKSSC